MRKHRAQKHAGTEDRGPRTGQQTQQSLGPRSLVHGPKKTGTVFLVGAGPGDAGLLTLRGLEVLKQADAVLYDGLVPQTIVDFAVQAEKIFVGKLSHLASERSAQPARSHHPQKHCRAPDQDQINRQMVDLARQGKNVVRLKGGDPFVFGRGGEEAEHLQKNRIPFEVVPGVSAGHAVPAAAGIPVTDRRFASAVIFVTAHEDPEKTKISIDWQKLAGIQATLVCFMGVKSLAHVTQVLIQGGRAPLTSACVIEWGTLPRQRVVEGTLQNIAERAEREKIESPALTVIGDVVNLRHKLGVTQKSAALSGKKILITRATVDGGPFKAMLEKEGATVLEAPMIKIEQPNSWHAADKTIREHLERSGWILFTSAHAVDQFFARLREWGQDARALSKCKIAVVGDKTAEVLKTHGIMPDILPRIFHSRELLRELQEKYFVRGQKFLWPRADIAPLELKNELEQAGGTVTDVILYHTVPDPEGKKRVAEILAQHTIDYVVFTSGSGVKNFFKNLGQREIQKVAGKVISIGPQTSQALQELKIPFAAQAKQHNLDGLIETLKELTASPVNRGPRTEKEEPVQSAKPVKSVFRSSTSRVQRYHPRSRRH